MIMIIYYDYHENLWKSMKIYDYDLYNVLLSMIMILGLSVN